MKSNVVVAMEGCNSTMGQAVCDSRGNLYVRCLVEESALTTPVLKVSPSGAILRRFELASVAGFEDGGANEFAVGPRGEVYVLAWDNERSGTFLVSFREDGEYNTTVQLESGSVPGRFAVFASGQFLVTGASIANENHPPNRPSLSVFDHTGKNVSVVLLPEGEEDEVQSPFPEDRPDLQPVIFRLFPGAGNDGNAYLLFWHREMFLYMISPPGDIVRTLRLTPPRRSLAPRDMKIEGGKIIVQYVPMEKAHKRSVQGQIFSVYDAANGERLEDYTAPPAATGPLLACYLHDTFVTFGWRRGKLAVVYSAPGGRGRAKVKPSGGRE